VVKEVEEKAIESAPGEPTNIIIEGDNYHALSVLNYTHAGKIDVIYIDPPYNTGNKDFIYNDCYVDKEDTFRHSKWLSFMEKRLKLAKNLLADDGAIFISIDENEQANLKLLCDSVFGEKNGIGTIVWHKKDNASFLSKSIVNLKEYILFYCRNSQCFSGTEDRMIDVGKHRELITKPSRIQERLFDKGSVMIENGHYTGLLKAGKYGNPQFAMEILESVYINSGRPQDDIKIKGKFCWSQQTLDKEIANGGKIEIKSVSGMKPIFYKNFGEDIPYRPIVDILSKTFDDRIKTTQDADRNIKEIFGNSEVFSYSKPAGLLSLLIGCNTRHKKNAIILDFFAGSGTTGQAVMELNKEDGGHRQFILVTNNEANGQADAGAEGIAEKVTYPRIKTVITGIRPDGTKYSDGIPANLRYFKTDFVEKGKTTDDTREALITECCDMIRIRENAFEHVASALEYRFYKNDKVFVPIIFDQFAIAETWELVEKLNTEKLPVHCYNFSYNRHANEEEIPEDTELTWTACSIPETVLEVYRKIFRKKEA